MRHVRHERTLNFGPAALTRSYCAACKQETLHVRGQCNHCKGQRNSSAGTVRAVRRARASRAEARGADQDFVSKARMRGERREP